MKFGVCLEAFGVPFRTALMKAAKLGAAGVQFDAVGELGPTRLSATGRREIQHLLRSSGLSLAALVCPLRRGLDDPHDLEPRLERVRQTMALSAELGARLVVVETGGIPAEDDPKFDTLVQSIAALARFGDRTGSVLAWQTGLDRGERVATFLGRFDSGALGVTLNPGQWLVHGFDPLAEAPALSGRIVHVHATDAKRGGASRMAGLAPLGHGDVDWFALAGALAAQDYRGWLVVERAGVHSETDLAAGIGLLRRLA